MVKANPKILLLFAILTTPYVTAQEISRDWPQFRGPTGQGIAADAKPPLSWSQTKNIAWKKPIPGRGWSSPVIYHGSVYLTTALENNKRQPTSLRVLRIDAATGDILWNREVFAPKGSYRKNDKNSNASPTPIIEDGRVYAHFGHMGTACIDVNGNVLWRQEKLTYDPYHGNGGSPILFEDKLIFSCDGAKDPFIAALNKITGDVAWRVNRTSTDAKNKFSFSTPLLIDANGRNVVVSPGSGAVCTYNPDNGKEIWRVDYGQGFSVIPRPVYGHGMVFIATEQGKTFVIKAGTRFEILAENNLQQRTLASLTVSGDALFIRTESHLYRIEDLQQSL